MKRRSPDSVCVPKAISKFPYRQRVAAPTNVSKPCARKSASKAGSMKPALHEGEPSAPGVIQRDETKSREKAGKKIHPFAGPPDTKKGQTPFDQRGHENEFSHEPRIVDRQGGRSFQ